MIKFKKIFLIFLFSFFLFIPNTSAKYIIMTEVTFTMQVEEIKPEIPEQIDFYIYNLEDLLNFRNLQNNKIVDFTGKNVYLMNDIDLSEYYNENSNWIPIASEENSFKGNFYGNFHKISNLKIQANSDCQGLFGKNDGLIKELKVQGEINANNCENIGGITGVNSGIISYSNSEITITGNARNVGGITGYCNQGSLIYNKNYNSILGDSNIGGICGYSQNAYIWRCGNEVNARNNKLE